MHLHSYLNNIQFGLSDTNSGNRLPIYFRQIKIIESTSQIRMFGYNLEQGNMSPNANANISGQGNMSPDTKLKNSGQGNMLPSTNANISGQGNKLPNTKLKNSGQGNMSINHV